MDLEGLPGRLSAVRSKWRDDQAGKRYALTRFKTKHAALRDPMIVERILEHLNVRPSFKPVLDAPCGAGRLRPLLERRGMRYVGLDASASMLGEAARGATRDLVRGSVERLPFQDDAFDIVVCCRLLHHIQTEEEIESVVRELVRVSYRYLIASFWDSASLHAWRRRVGLRKSEGAGGRHSTSKRVLRRMIEGAGAEVVDFHHSFRFVSQQAFVVAQKRCPADEQARDVHHLRSRLFALDLESAPGSLGEARA
jgi:SAM-dependent methyltransferase